MIRMMNLTKPNSSRIRTMLAASACGILASSSAHAVLIHHWDFNAGNELVDSAGSLDLIAAPGEGDVGGTAGTAGDIIFEAGYNGIGQAYRPFYVDPTQSSTAGAGLTGGGFTSPNQFTIETILKPDAKSTGSAVNYIFQTRPGSDRGYYLVQDDPTSVGSIIGSSFGDYGEAATYDAGDWLYVAAVVDLTTTPGQASAQIYVANLTDGETVPTLALNKSWNTADPSSLAGATGIFGIGNFAIDRGGDGEAEASQEWFQGAIDYVSIHDTQLSSTDLENNLQARLVPEPSISIFAGFAAALAFVRRRRG